MARVHRIQTNFSAGELDRNLRSRTDLRYYYSGAGKLRNLLVKPQGGAVRRPGTQYLDTVPFQITRVSSSVTATAPNGGTASNANDDSESTAVLTTAGVGTTNPFVIVHYDLASAKTIQFADAVGLKVDGGSGVAAEVFIQYSTDNASWTSLGAAVPALADKTNRRRTGPITARYWRLARIGTTDLSTNDFSVDEFTLWEMGSTVSQTRAVNFTFSTEQQYGLVFSDRNLRIYKDGVSQADVRTPYTSAQLGTLTWVQSLDTLLAFHEDVAVQRLIREGSDTAWSMRAVTWDTIPQYAFTLTEQEPAQTLTPSATTGYITLTTGGAVWLTGDVGSYVNGNFGRARIIEYTSTTVVKAFVTVPFFSTAAIASGDWNLEAGYEAAWSATRGYPICGTFYQGRLWIGGSRDLPSTMWGSHVGELFEFDPATGLDDEAIEYTLDANDVAAIKALHPGRHLQIFTGSSEWYIPQNPGAPITPSNVAVDVTTKFGCREGLPVIDVSGAVLFIQREGKAIREFLFTDTEQAYTAQNISLLAPHLIRTPVDFALRKATSTDESDLIILINSDGTASSLTTLRDQEITSWQLHSTDGLFKNAMEVDSEVYFVVERTINGTTSRFLERFNSTMRTDCGVYLSTGGTTITGLSHLNGESVKVIIDDSVQSDATVAGGSITLSRTADSTREAGLKFVVTDGSLPRDETIPTNAETWGKLMPVAFDPQSGAALAMKKKRILRVQMDLLETVHIICQGERASFRGFGAGSGGGSPLDIAPPVFTGQKEFSGLLGYDDLAELQFWQTEPAYMTVLGVKMEVSV